MTKLLSVRTIGLIAVTIVLLSGLFFFTKSRRNGIVVLVPLDRSTDTESKVSHLPRIKIQPLEQSKPNNIVNNVVHIVEPPPILVEANGYQDDDDLEIPVPDGVDSRELVVQLQEKQMRGVVNYDIWWNVVGYFVDDLRIFKYFPKQPDERKKLSKLHVEFNGVSVDAPSGRYAHKVFGYLLPPKPGRYLFQFVINKLTAACAVELWISPGASPLDIKKRLVLEYDDLTRPTKRIATTLEKHAEIRLTGTIHYFEYLMKAFEGFAIVDLLWQPPGTDGFVPIPSEHLAMAQELTSDGDVVEGPITKIIRGPLPSNNLQSHHRAYYVGNIIYPISKLDDVLPHCDFNAEYAWAHRVKTYTGVNQVLHSKVYPKDDTWFKNWEAKDKGNPVIDDQTAQNVYALYEKAFNASKHKGEVSHLVNLEETVNKKQGSRFLIELVIKMENPSELINISEYVYLPTGGNQLCHTANFQWKSEVRVYLVVAVKNLGFWISHLMQNMEEIYAATRDDKFTLIVVDFSSEDTSVDELMSKSSFKNWHLINQPGEFSRSSGLQAGVDYVTDPGSIVMTIDMHLTLPTGFVEATRRHSVQGKMGYTPYFFRLNKGYTEINWNGFWETLTYGIFGMFKSDWTNFKGFNVIKYKNKWGGEDWDILDKALAKGYEMFRLRLPGFVHYQHTKAGMWGGKT